jgi:NAD+ kinase
MKKVCLYPNRERDAALLGAKKVAEAFLQYGAEVYFPDAFKAEESLLSLRNQIQFVSKEEFFSVGDVLVPLGGDGTILSVAECAAETGIPIFGINFGTVGFLTAVEGKALAEISALMKGEYSISSRMMLSCRINSEPEFLALNEFVIAPSEGFHIVELSLFQNEKKLCDFRADGLIFNTPTGSTGYSFSAGGAVIDAEFDSIGVKAVSSYLLINAHHMIFSPETEFKVNNFRTAGGNLTVCADGRKPRRLSPEDTVFISRAKKRANLVFLKPQSNLEVFFRKF